MIFLILFETFNHQFVLESWFWRRWRALYGLCNSISCFYCTVKENLNVLPDILGFPRNFGRWKKVPTILFLVLFAMVISISRYGTIISLWIRKYFDFFPDFFSLSVCCSWLIPGARLASTFLNIQKEGQTEIIEFIPD